MSTFRDRTVGVGVAVAGAMGGAIAFLGTTISPDWSAPLAYVLPLSLPVGILMAVRHARAVVESPRFPIGRVVVMSLQALVIGALLTGGASVLIGVITDARPVGSVWEAVGIAVYTAFLGVIFVGIPMLAMIGPIVGLWAIVLRRLARAHLAIHRGDELRRAGKWALVAVGSSMGSQVIWPLFGLVGIGGLGWFLALGLWIVLFPVALILTAMSVRRALTAG